METDWISILDLIKKSKFEASIITTFNAYLPFYEEVVLRRLISTGCRHNILMMDVAQFNECLQAPTSRPFSAGYDYTLVPMKANGAFHPKIIFLLGRRKGLIFVGSHNMTISGLGINKELTTKIEVSDGKEKKGIYFAQEVWSFLDTWMKIQSENLPDEIYKIFNSTIKFAPWLNSKVEIESNGYNFLGSEPDGISLWEKLREKIQGGMERVTVVGPFFDEKLVFLNTLNKNLSPKEIVVGIEPETVHIKAGKSEIDNIRFVDVTELFKNNGYLHAKTIYLEGGDNNFWLATGSANPSAPAWINSEDIRNAEAIILHEGKTANLTATEIGLNEVCQLPPLQQEVLDNIRERISQIKEKQESKETSDTVFFVAISDDDNVIIKNQKINDKNFIKAELLNQQQEILYTIETCEIEDYIVKLSVPEKIMQNIRFIQISLKEEKTLFCLVHHDRKIMAQSRQTPRIQFKKYLEDLHSGTPDIENLIATIEKLIFDEQVEEDVTVRKQTKTKEEKAEDETRIQLKTLAVNLKDTAKEKRRKRMVTSGDIGSLIDILIYQLGVGLESKNTGTDHKGRSEEEQVGEDDDEPEVEAIKIDLSKLIKVCKGKVKRLVSRMISNFEKTASDRKKYSTCIIKLLAVLAMLRELRSIKRDDMLIGEVIVPMDERRRLFENSVKFLYGQSHMILINARNELIDEPMDEISRLNALMLWLAHDCGADLFSIKEFNESPEVENRRQFYKSNILLFLSLTAVDEVAIKEAKQSIYNTTRISKRHYCKKWLDNHVMAGKKCFKYQNQAVELNKKIIEQNIKAIPKTGGIAFLRDKPFPSLHLVLESGNSVTLADIDSENGKSLFPKEKLIGFPIPKPIQSF